MPARKWTIAVLAAALFATAGCGRQGTASPTPDAPHPAAPRDGGRRAGAEEETPAPAAKTRVIRLTVRAAAGDAAVAGASIVRHDDGRELGRTDAQGTARVELADPPTAIDVWAPRFATSVVTSAAGTQAANDALAVSLVTGVPLRGRALDAATGAPIAGARVTAHGDTMDCTDACFGTATSGPDGRFEVAGVPSHLFRGEDDKVGPWIECRIAAAGHVVTDVSERPPEDAPLLDVGDVRLEPAARVRVRVLHADGRPAAGVRVCVVDDVVDAEPEAVTRATWDEPAPDVRTDAAGDAMLDGMRRDFRLVLSASADDWTEIGSFVGVAVPRGATEGRVEIRLEPRGRLVVRVRDADGTEIPAADSTVWIERVDGEGASHVVGGDPRVLRGLRPGKSTIHAEREHGGSADAEVDITAGDNEAAVVIGGRATLAGRAVDDHGEPVSRAGVELYDAAGRSQGAVTTDVSGEFVIERLAAGEYVLHAESEHQDVARMNVTAPGHDVVVVIERRSFATVRLHAPDGTELPARAWVKDVTGDAASDRDTQCGYGIFERTIEFAAAAHGRRTFAIGCDGFEDVRVTVDLVAGQTRSFGDATLVPRPMFAGRVLDEEGRPVAETRYIVRDSPYASGQTTSDGRFTFVCPPKWRGVVHAHAPGLAGSADVGADTPRDVIAVTLHPTTPLDVRVEEPHEGRSRVREIQVVRPRDGEVFFDEYAGGQGRARLDVLPGTWVVRATGDDDRTLAETSVELSSVTANPREIVLTLR